MGKSITKKIVADVIIALLALGALLCYVGYFQSSLAIEKQYEDTALRTGRTALTFVDPEKIPYYNDVGGDFYEETMKLAAEWERLSETQGATFIYIIQPNIEKNYEEIRFSLSVMNSQAKYDHFNSGHVKETSNEEYRQAYINLYEGKKEFSTIIRDKGVSSTGDHITILLPVKNSSDEIRGILCVQRQMEDLRGFRIAYLRNMFIATAGVFLLVILIYGIYIKKTVLTPIKTLTDGVNEISGGSLDKKIEITTGDEIEQLAKSFNDMTDKLKSYMDNLTKITAEKERISTELDVAKNIQISMLPTNFPAFPDHNEFDIYASMNAAKEVGGDFYDFYLLDENHLVVTIADVSGKGIPAALFMMISKTILKNFSMTMINPDDFSAVMTLANNQLCQNNDAMMFVTVFMGMLDLKTGEFTFVNGGHNPPVVYHKATDTYEYIKVKKNFVLGGMEDINFKQQSIKLEKGDLIFMYTDGVTEALNKSEELYGEERLINCLNRSDKNLSVEELLKFVRADVNAHVNGAAQSDDITMIALKINP